MRGNVVGCCEIDEEEKAKDEAMLAEEITLEGMKLKIGDLFPSTWEARDFHSKLTLLRKGSGTKRTEETLEEDLF